MTFTTEVVFMLKDIPWVQKDVKLIRKNIEYCYAA